MMASISDLSDIMLFLWNRSHLGAKLLVFLGLLGGGLWLFIAQGEKALAPTPAETSNSEVAQQSIPDPQDQNSGYAEVESRWQNPNLPLEMLTLPEGFEIEVLATNIKGARSLSLSENGVVYVGTRKEGNVYALEDRDNNGKVDRVDVIAQNLNNPNGVAWRDGNLYVAEINRLLRFPDIDERRSNPPKPEIIREDYPTDPHHGWKFIAFGPEGDLYVPVGAPCNNCVSEDPIYASITRLNLETNQREIIAHGVRNTVGFDWHPQTGQLWFTDNGRDWAGDNRPPDELNRLTSPGQHFGYPFCHGTDFIDPQFGTDDSCEKTVAPVQELGPHVAALGMEFYIGDQFPDQYRNQIFIAEHGSWNRTVPIGYRLTMVRLENETPTSYEPFISGWLQTNGEAWGRPVDIEIMEDGSLLISDDYSGTIYRVTFNLKQKN